MQPSRIANSFNVFDASSTPLPGRDSCHETAVLDVTASPSASTIDGMSDPTGTAADTTRSTLVASA